MQKVFITTLLGFQFIILWLNLSVESGNILLAFGQNRTTDSSNVSNTTTVAAPVNLTEEVSINGTLNNSLSSSGDIDLAKECIGIPSNQTEVYCP